VVDIEVASGCLQGCSFCGVREHRLNFMDPRLLCDIMSQMLKLQWEPRVLFSGHGDPSHHPALPHMVALAKNRTFGMYSLTIMTSAGGWRGHTEAVDQTIEVLRARANCVAIGDYGRFARRLRSGDGSALEILLPGLRYGEFPRDSWADPHRRHRLDTMMVVVAESPLKSGEIDNQAGAAFPPNNSGVGRKCHRPIREMVIGWDGTVRYCANDLAGESPLGHVSEGLERVWKGPAARAARYRAATGDRSLRPCQGCDYRSPARFARRGVYKVAPPAPDSV
jgi:radical SAM protein with 4Fe4S-binding SPASM domain